MTKLTPEQQELLENWGLKLSKILANEIEGYKSYHRTHAAKDAIMVECSNFEINELIRSLLAAKDARLADAVEKEREKLEEAKDIIEGLAMQYGLELPGPLLHSGAISAMECAFEFLDWDDPFPIPERKCDVGTCIQPATCGKPTSDGYKKLCREHWNFFKQK